MSSTIQKQILIGAEALLATEGDWIKKKYHNEDETAFCIRGAIQHVIEKLGLDLDSDIYSRTTHQLSDMLSARGSPGLSKYNDCPSTTFANIKALLREAIQTVDA